jgi:Protein of unknown function (DUF2493).
MRIQITGSRDFTDYEQVKDAIAYTIGEVDMDEPVLIVSGHAKGADSLAERVAESYGLPLELHPAEWGKHYLPGSDLPEGATLHCPANHKGLGLCKMAGIRRNQVMLSRKPDVLLAFKKEGAANKGTQHMIDEAKRRGITVWEYVEAE